MACTAHKNSSLLRFRLAYNLYGWQILTVALFVVPIGGFIWWAVVKNARPTLPLVYPNTLHGFEQSDTTAFQCAILYAAAHHYASDHNGRLPDAAHWPDALTLFVPERIPLCFRRQPRKAQAALS